MEFLTYGICTGLLVCIAGSSVVLSSVPDRPGSGASEAYPRYEHIGGVNDGCDLYRHHHSEEKSEVIKVCIED